MQTTTPAFKKKKQTQLSAGVFNVKPAPLNSPNIGPKQALNVGSLQKFTQTPGLQFNTPLNVGSLKQFSQTPGLQVNTPQAPQPTTPSNVQQAQTMQRAQPQQVQQPMPQAPQQAPQQMQPQVPQAQADTSQRDALRQQLTQSNQLSPDQLRIQQSLNNLLTGTEQGLENIRQQPIARGFLTGQSAALQRQSSLQATPLQRQLGLLQQQQQSRQQGISQELGFANQDLAFERGEIASDQQTQEEQQAQIQGLASSLLEAGATQEQIQGILRSPDINTALQQAAGTGLLRPQDVGGVSGGGVGGGGGEGSSQNVSPLAQSILNNPNLFNSLTPSEQGNIIPELDQAGFKFPKKLSATQQDAQVDAQSALLSLQRLKDNLFDEDGTLDRSKIAFAKFGIGIVSNDIAELTDVKTRIRTGAALTDNEIKFYRKQAPLQRDTAETAEKKLDQLAAFYAGIAGSAITLQSPDGELFEFDNMFDPRQRDDVRRALAANWSLEDF